MKMRNWVWDGGPKINFLAPRNKIGDNGQGLKNCFTKVHNQPGIVPHSRETRSYLYMPWSPTSQ
jgi:hypothetical protein